MANRTCTVDGCDRPARTKGLCKPCYRRDYYLRNGERERANFKAWREANLEHERARWATYYSENTERLSVLMRAAYYANHEARLAHAVEYRRRNPGIGDQWRKADPEKWALRNRANQARRRTAPKAEPVDFAAIIERDGMWCYLCEKPIASLDDLHFDHVIPLSKGGPHTAANIRPSHALCNLRKGARLIA